MIWPMLHALKRITFPQQRITLKYKFLSLLLAKAKFIQTLKSKEALKLHQLQIKHVLLNKMKKAKCRNRKNSKK